MNIRPIPLKLRTLALLCLLPLTASALEAAVFYVDGTNGDNANTGTTWAKAKKTIQGGVDVATDGDAVIVAPGTYTGEGNKAITFNGKKLLLQSRDGADTTIINCEDDGAAFSLTAKSEDEKVVGFTMTGMQGTSTGGTYHKCLIKQQ